MVKGKKRNKEVEFETGLKGRSGRVVVAAILINSTIFILKIIVWIFTHSHSMFAESIHSAADTVNQIILAFGLYKSAKNPNIKHPYGYANMKYISSLISGVAIFCVGTGFSFYHGIDGLSNTDEKAKKKQSEFIWAYIVLGGSFCFESVTLMMAIISIRKSAKQANQSFISYVASGADPCVNVVLFEDSAAVAGAGVAAVCIGLTAYLKSSIPDAIGSLLVGVMLGAVAILVVYTSVPALVGRSIKLDQLDKINQELESDAMIKAIHDVKGIDMGNSMIRYKAEIDFNGRELTRKYLEEHDIRKLWEEVKGFHSIDQLNEFMLRHGEKIVDIMGDEIDRIEMNLSKKFPKVRHIDLELE
ncbi:zinc transporter 9-like [Contarinia nasturtii]|uniref:zinc transporter 9-like n=1 Tax=Contarinia nasturtii TaxID=265458 RepID=UPI0012D401D7|nr:zinc transporter 9-like [Contarinia nasturtii]XP_031627461.1 zinc transporter 9-like [Contarinia nasturtii]XP_031627462.1 zinc transporter 9-like [Contarinia nasturtii]XP_031627463.1 zinc transporter 9-like [Contarinia nasturtii]XP_031627464.1 zinc transporter 9-like [Contarinia nasturtii]XP_031627465.1 zinc transporter 9-like [Contarinia nasturtii]XP_031627466.1 zinc transporter 9-like [Contarinia nasturtii]XP_031627467.1 zinc transporter 9-like [Contarinia nasturtii]XP_031627468.1 zinc